jgi:hypothetical protein
MKTIPEKVYKQIDVLSKEIKNQFLKKGIVIPTRNPDGSVRIGYYSVKKTSDGFFEIDDWHGCTIVDKINLPQTAILLANNLSLGKFVDKTLLNADRQYGYAAFEEAVQKRVMNRSRDLEHYGLMLNKLNISRFKKECFKRDILRSFEKLTKFV